MITNNFLYRFKDALLILIPLALITGSAFSDIFCSLSGIILLLVISKKEFKFFFLNRYSIIFFSWCFYLIILSLTSVNIFLSLENSLFYFRFGVFALAIWHSVLNNNNFTKYFNYSLVAVLSFVIIDSYFQFILEKHQNNTFLEDIFIRKLYENDTTNNKLLMTIRRLGDNCCVGKLL